MCGPAVNGSGPHNICVSVTHARCIARGSIAGEGDTVAFIRQWGVFGGKCCRRFNFMKRHRDYFSKTWHVRTAKASFNM